MNESVELMQPAAGPARVMAVLAVVGNHHVEASNAAGGKGRVEGACVVWTSAACGEHSVDAFGLRGPMEGLVVASALDVVVVHGWVVVGGIDVLVPVDAGVEERARVRH